MTVYFEFHYCRLCEVFYYKLLKIFIFNIFSRVAVFALKTLVYFFFRDKAHAVGKAICERLKDAIPRQLFEIAIQAAIGNKIIARET